MIKVFSDRKDKPVEYDFVAIDEQPQANEVGFKTIEVSISPDAKTWTSMYDVSELDRIYCVDTPGVADIKQTDNTVNQGIADGQLFVSSKFDQREIKAIFKFDSNDSSDVRLAYDALQRYFGSREPYWICFADFPQRMYFVKMTSVDQTSFRDWGFVLEVTFTDQIGLSRSIGTTGDQGNYLYGFGNNELTSKPQFSFSTNKFTLYNPSDVAIDPERRGHPFKITLDGSAGGDMTIKNTTNGTSITRKGKWSGKWVLDGVHSTLNDKGDTINTDYGYIGLQAGNNSFEITGFSGKVSFDFPVWWLS